MKHNDENLVLIYESGSLPEMAVIKSLLDSQKIRYIVRNEGHPVRILVHENDVAKAKKLLLKKNK